MSTSAACKTEVSCHMTVYTKLLTPSRWQVDPVVWVNLP
jgi:hypothetical protein